MALIPSTIMQTVNSSPFLRKVNYAFTCDSRDYVADQAERGTLHTLMPNFYNIVGFYTVEIKAMFTQECS